VFPPEESGRGENRVWEIPGFYYYFFITLRGKRRFPHMYIEKKKTAL
jgi:hypothetical protein